MAAGACEDAPVSEPLILFPTDFSENSAAALDYASALAAQRGGRLQIVHVSEAMPTAERPVTPYHSLSGIVEAETAAREDLEKVRPTVPGVAAERSLLHGDPGEEIIQFAEHAPADLIVMGTHGRTGITKLLMGSVAEAVVRGAPCPVVVVKRPAEASAHPES